MSNTVLSLSALQKYDSRPFFVCIVASSENYLLLANTTFLKKISHSSQELRIDNIKGSFNGSDIIFDFQGIENTPKNFQSLYAYHEGLSFQDNLERLVESTNGIVGRVQKYQVTNARDEINDLGRSINTMSDKLERTIKQLRSSNIELERDIEEKSKIDEMRKTFISDVSHELKTPIALIQGYSEGLLENVNSDEESRKFYAEVILDETNKMDKLVKQLLELMKLEYGKREFHNKEFNIVELEKEVIRKTNVMIEEKQAEIKFDDSEEIQVFADDFYIEQVLTNYLTNAIKNVKEMYGEKYIKISNEIRKDENKVCIKVFNTGEKISEENLNRIWNRFYKADESRHREDGGTGIGLAFVKAIMGNYDNKYGVNNLENGVEFYFELDMRQL